jgi:hypothetical protein
VPSEAVEPPRKPLLEIVPHSPMRTRCSRGRVASLTCKPQSPSLERGRDGCHGGKRHTWPGDEPGETRRTGV